MPEKKQEEIKDSIFKTLRAINLEDKHKNKDIGKNRVLSYLPWATAWASVKSVYPEATFRIVRNDDGWIYFTDGKTCWVETEVTIGGLNQGEVLAVMNNSNKSISYDEVTSVDIQKSLARCLTKNLGSFGLDLNLWEGEEFSDEVRELKEKKEKEEEALKAKKKEIGAAGSDLMKKGFSKEQIMDIVGKLNDGNQNPSSIKTLEVCESVMNEFKKLEATLSSEPAKEEKKATKNKGAQK